MYTHVHSYMSHVTYKGVNIAESASPDFLIGILNFVIDRLSNFSLDMQ